jgi:hypothetical protein
MIKGASDMFITATQAFILFVTIVFMIYLVYKSKLRLLEVESKAEQSKMQMKQAVSNMAPNLEGLRKVNGILEQVLAQQKNGVKAMCHMDETKECDICDIDCPYKKGGKQKWG